MAPVSPNTQEVLSSSHGLVRVDHYTRAGRMQAMMDPYFKPNRQSHSAKSETGVPVAPQNGNQSPGIKTNKQINKQIK